MTIQEEILNKYVSLYFSSHHDKSQWNGEGENGGAEWHTDKAIAADIYKAMDEFAKQQAIDFDEWRIRGRWFSFENGYYYHTFEQGTSMSDAYYKKNYVKTREQLYDLFIEQQNKG